MKCQARGYWPHGHCPKEATGVRDMQGVTVPLCGAHLRGSTTRANRNPCPECDPADVESAKHE
jgi:hypothetical protein